MPTTILTINQAAVTLNIVYRVFHSNTIFWHLSLRVQLGFALKMYFAKIGNVVVCSLSCICLFVHPYLCTGNTLYIKTKLKLGI